MSRIAKAPIPVASGLDIKIDGQSVTVKGKKGTLSFQVRPEIEVAQNDGEIVVKPRKEDKAGWMHAGTTRAVLNNMVVGCGEGFEKKLSLIGVGYRAQAKGNVLNLSLGFSHPVDYPVPEGISVETPSRLKSLSRARTSRRWGRLPRKFAATVRQSPTRARVFDTPTNTSCVRKPRRSKGFDDGQKASTTAPRPESPGQDSRAGRTSPVRASYAAPYLCPGDVPRWKSVLASASTLDKAARTDRRVPAIHAAAAAVGKAVAERAKAAGVETVAFDRSGFQISRPCQGAGRCRA